MDKVKISEVLAKLNECQKDLIELDDISSVSRDNHSSLSESIRNIENIKRLLNNIK